MKQCPQCKTEYDDLEEGCGKCTFAASAAGEWIALTTVLNDIEFGMVEGLMELAHIPVVRTVRGIDEIIAGIPINGIDVMVPSDRYEEAQQLLNAQVDGDGVVYTWGREVEELEYDD